MDTTTATAYHGPTPIYFKLMQEQPPESYVRRLFGNGNELDEAAPARRRTDPLPIEGGTVHGPGVFLPGRPDWAGQGPHTGTIILPGGLEKLRARFGEAGVTRLQELAAARLDQDSER